MGTVELGMNAWMPHPFEDGKCRRAATEGLYRADIPAEQVEFQLRATLDQPVEEFTNTIGFTGQTLLGGQVDAGIKIPADKHNPAFGLQKCVPRQPEINVGIDDHRHLVGAGDPPAILALAQDSHCAVVPANGAGWQAGLPPRKRAGRCQPALNISVKNSVHLLKLAYFSLSTKPTFVTSDLLITASISSTRA